MSLYACLDNTRSIAKYYSRRLLPMIVEYYWWSPSQTGNLVGST